MTTLRAEHPADEPTIRHVNQQAFGRPEEAALVDALRREGALVVSLVACLDDGAVVGHIAFSPIRLEPEKASLRAVCLAPLAVLPEQQNQGIGQQLVQAGLDACQQAGYEMVIVVGHPAYYPRSGFVTARPHGLTCEFEVPDEAFMVRELREGALAEHSGLVRFHHAFHAAM